MKGCVVKPFVWIAVAMVLIVIVFAIFAATILILTHVFIRRRQPNVDFAEKNGQETDAQKMYLLTF